MFHRVDCRFFPVRYCSGLQTHLFVFIYSDNFWFGCFCATFTTDAIFKTDFTQRNRTLARLFARIANLAVLFSLVIRHMIQTVVAKRLQTQTTFVRSKWITASQRAFVLTNIFATTHAFNDLLAHAFLTIIASTHCTF